MLLEFHIFGRSGNYYLLAVKSSKWFKINKFIAEFLIYSNKNGLNCAIDYFGSKYGTFFTNNIVTEVAGTGLISKNSENHNEDSMAKWPVTAIQLHVTHRCNLSCSYCYANQGNYGGPSNDMNWDTAKRAVEFLISNSSDRKKIKINFFGGEPLLNLPIIKKTVSYAREKASEHGKVITFGVTTNGTLLNKDVRDYLNSENIRFMVSLDGPSKFHDKNRYTKCGGPTHETIVKNLRDQAKDNYPISVRATHTTFDDDIRDIYQELNILPIYNGFVSPISNPRQDYYMNMKKLNKCILEEELDYLDKNGEIRLSPFLRIVDQIDKGHFITYPCGAGRNFLAITPDGEIYFCHRFVLNEKFRLGSIWDDLSSFRRISVQNVDERPSCRNCWARYHCGGQCYHECEEAFSDIYNVNKDFCDYFKSLVEDAVCFLSALYEHDSSSNVILELTPV